MVKRLLLDSGRQIGEIDGFAVVTGPGSYTGLRIGIGAVKGLCMGSGKGCAGVSALEAVAWNFSGSESTVCACMHARQNLYYGAFFKTHAGGGVTRLASDRLIPLEELAVQAAMSDGEPVICAGDGGRAVAEAASTCGIAAGGRNANIQAAPLYMNRPSPVGIAMSAIAGGFYSPEELAAEYMSITKAEKDLGCKE